MLGAVTQSEKGLISMSRRRRWTQPPGEAQGPLLLCAEIQGSIYAETLLPTGCSQTMTGRNSDPKGALGDTGLLLKPSVAQGLFYGLAQLHFHCLGV